jgi:NADH:ubiquinone oxidoreductase subunit C
MFIYRLGYFKIGQKFLKQVYKMLPIFIEGAVIHDNTFSIFVKENNLNKLVFFIKKHFNFWFLADILLVDVLVPRARFHVDYNIRVNQFSTSFSFLYKCQSHIVIHVVISQTNTLPSIALVFSSANSMEREIWDMYGVYFNKHPNLRRILTDYGFQGHPFRKDFPLTGYVETRYDASLQRVVLEPVELTQEFRNFDFLSPWI